MTVVDLATTIHILNVLRQPVLVRFLGTFCADVLFGSVSASGSAAAADISATRFESESLVNGSR
jgi:hypothetical protein